MSSPEITAANAVRWRMGLRRTPMAGNSDRSARLPPHQVTAPAFEVVERMAAIAEVGGQSKADDESRNAAPAGRGSPADAAP
jgi:hypothetical protein